MTYVTKHEAAALLGLTYWQLHRRTYQCASDLPKPVLVLTGQMGRSKAMWVRAEVDAWRANHAA